jgi:hypothetical protein
VVGQLHYRRPHWDPDTIQGRTNWSFPPCQGAWRVLDPRAVLADNSCMPTETAVRKSLGKATSDARRWFNAASTPKDRGIYFAHGKLGDNGKGAVYAYFDKDQETLYVGQAGRAIKRRMHDELSKHKLAKWWKSWETVRFVQLEDRTDRLTLELLLILALKPKYNSKPGAREISQMFRVRLA